MTGTVIAKLAQILQAPAQTRFIFIEYVSLRKVKNPSSTSKSQSPAL